jgi:hypothetical protein
VKSFTVRLMPFAPGKRPRPRTLVFCRLSATVILVPDVINPALQMK